MTSKIEKFAAQLAQAEATQVGIDPLNCSRSGDYG